jgi:hypothetical protein
MTMGDRPAAVLTSLLLAALPSLYAQQSSGSIRGTVRDAQGAVVPSAKVSLTDVAQGDTRELATTQDGVFFFNPLKPSVYKLTVEASGFKKYERDEIKVFANDRLEVPDIALSVGQMTESITVSAEAVLLQTRGAEKSGVLTGSQVVNLALTTRNFLDLTKTIPVEWRRTRDDEPRPDCRVQGAHELATRRIRPFIGRGHQRGYKVRHS